MSISSEYGNTNVNKEFARNVKAGFTLSGSPITARLVNGESIDLYVFSTVSNTVVLESYTCTGSVWSVTLGTANYFWLEGLGVNDAGDKFVDGIYNYVFDTSNNNYWVTHYQFSAAVTITENISGNNAATIYRQKTLRSQQLDTTYYFEYSGGSENVSKQLDISLGNASFLNMLAITDNVNSLTAAYLPWQDAALVSIGIDEMGNWAASRVTLLPAPAANEYYEAKISFKFTFGSVAFTFADNIGIYEDSNDAILAVISGNIITGNEDRICGPVTIPGPSPLEVTDNYVYYDYIKPGFGISLGSFDGATNATLGDGTLNIAIKYRIHTV